jgi:hypothetical protein
MCRLWAVACVALAAGATAAHQVGERAKRGYEPHELHGVNGPDTLGRGWHLSTMGGEQLPPGKKKVSGTDFGGLIGEIGS